MKVAVGLAMRVTGRTIACGADETVSSASGSLIRKVKSKLNKAFAPDFQSVQCEFSADDGAAVVSVDVPDFLAKVSRRKRKLPLIKFALMVVVARRNFLAR